VRILHLLSQRPDATGSGYYLQAMVREAAASGHENFVVAGLPAGQGRLPTDLCTAGSCCVPFGAPELPFEIVGMSDVMPYPSRRFRDLSAGQIAAYETCFRARLQEAGQAFRPQIVHSHHLWLLTALARRAFPDLPVVATCHGTDLRQFRNCPHLRRRVAAPCRDLDAVMALSPAQAEEIAALYAVAATRIHTVGVGYDAARFHPRPPEAPSGGPVRLLYAGKLCRAKGLPWLLRALARCGDTDWRLDLAGGGSGAERQECLALAASLGERVTVHGPLPQERLASLMRRAHIFLLSSFFEGTPLVLLEALACGCRLLATALPGVRDLVGEQPPPCVRLVAPPRLEGVDRPAPGEGEPFETRLAAALKEEIAAARRQPGGDPLQAAPLLARASWPVVFGRVERVYAEALAARRY
jgi:glycosyltransferase involved in cell wall biosynthesis